MVDLRVVPSGIKVGDEVSECFNGDSYPVGKVEKVFKKYVVAGGKKYSMKLVPSIELIRNEAGRVVDSDNVLKEGFKGVNSPFWLVAGVVNERNPSF